MGKRDKIRKEQYKAILKLCEKKYEEENYREKTINSKAGFLLTVLSILISISINILVFLYDIKYVEVELASWYIYLIVILLIASLSFTICSQFISKRKYFPKINQYIDALNENDDNDNYGTISSNILMYETIIENKFTNNDKCARLLKIAFIILLATLLLVVSYSIILLIRSNV